MSDTKRVLVIGNGFDLAHGLKTKYMEVLKAVNLRDNICYKYFHNLIKNQALVGSDWIDFEAEISLVISTMDKYSVSLEHPIRSLKIEDFVILDKLQKNLFNLPVGTTRKNNRTVPVQDATFFEVREQLFKDLELLIESLDKYLVEKVETVQVEKLKILADLSPEVVVNFNYTHTFTNNYGNNSKLFFVHGECGKGSESNNMVLGIEEYWTDGRQDTHTSYAIFKKYIQRMQRGTYRALQDSYNTIINILPSTELKLRNPNNKSELYFYGHSLAITDKDILLKLLQMNFGKTIVYYYSKPDEGQYMANMVVILGKDEFEKRMMDDKLEFRQIPKEEKTDTEHEKQLAGTV